MKGKPILFNGPMVRALLDGRKTQTRRVVKPQPSEGTEAFYRTPDTAPDGGRFIALSGPVGKGIHLRNYGRKYAPGSLLWVRETWGYRSAHWYNKEPEIDNISIEYRADKGRQEFVRAHGDESGLPKCRAREGGESYEEYQDYLSRYWKAWRPSIHMPRWASRITLRITDVRVERVQDITREDAATEGLGSLNTRADSVYSAWDSDPLDEFCELWDSLNAKRGYGWDENPWVWVLSFDVIRRNIDEYLLHFPRNSGDRPAGNAGRASNQPRCTYCGGIGGIGDDVCPRCEGSGVDSISSTVKR